MLPLWEKVPKDNSYYGFRDLIHNGSICGASGLLHLYFHPLWPRVAEPYGSFRKLGAPHFGVLIIRIHYLRYYIRVPYFRRLPKP